MIMANDAIVTSVGGRETKRGRWQLGQLEIRPSESWISATWELSHFTPSALEYWNRDSWPKHNEPDQPSKKGDDESDSFVLNVRFRYMLQILFTKKLLYIINFVGAHEAGISKDYVI